MKKASLETRKRLDQRRQLRIGAQLAMTLDTPHRGAQHLAMGWKLLGSLALAIAGVCTATSSSAAPRKVSLHELSDSAPAAPATGEVRRYTLGPGTELLVDPQKQPPRLSPPQAPADDARGSLKLAEQALADPDPKSRLAKLKTVANGASGRVALQLWFEIAAFEDRPTARAHALQRAITSAVGGSGSLQMEREQAQLALLETLAWHADRDGRLRLAAQILAQHPSESTASAALVHAEQALLQGARAHTTQVPLPYAVRLAEQLSTNFDRYPSDGAPRRALEFLAQQGDVLAAEQLERYRERQRLSEPWQALRHAPQPDLYSQLQTLVLDCAALYGHAHTDLAVTIGAGRGPGAVTVSPLGSQLAHCLVRRGPEYLRYTPGRAKLNLVYGRDAGWRAQVAYENFLIVGTHHSLADARQNVRRLEGLLGLETGKKVDPDSNEYWQRGRYDQGAYLSIEESGRYPGLRPGLFVVMAANGDEAAIAWVRAKAKRAGVPSYTRELPVYMGCIH